MPTRLPNSLAGQDGVKYHSRTIYGVALATAVALLLSISIYIDDTYQHQYRQSLREQTYNQLHQIQSNLEGTLTITTQSVIGLAAAISSEPNMSQAKFSAQAQYLKQNAPQLLSLSAAPDMVIAMVYPEKENKAALGLNLATHPTQSADALRARQLRELILTGPIQLVQGGRAFVGRMPVFIPANKQHPEIFWGLVSALISPEILFQQSGLMANDLPINVSIRNHVGLRMQQLFGEQKIYNEQPITSNIRLPYGTWEIAAVPVAGWNQKPPNLALFRLIITIINLVILLPLFFVADLLRKKQSNEHRLRGLIRLSPIGIALNKFSNGQFIEINDALLAPTGYTKEEFLNLSYWELTPKEYEEQENKQLELLRTTGQYGPYEKEYIRKDGSRYPVKLNGMLLNDTDGQRYIWSIIEDITELKHNEENAIRQQQRLETMSRQGRIGAWEYNYETETTYWSRMTREIHGVGDDDNIGPETITDFYPHKPSLRKLQSALKWARIDGTPWQEEVLLRRADGREIWILSTGHAEFRNNKCVRIYGACQDINDQVNLRKELIEAKEAAEAATSAKSLFLATMSHEIRTPLNGVLGMLNLLQRDKLQPDQRRKVTLAKNSADALLSLINDILDFSKIEAGKLELEAISFSLLTLIENAVETLAVQAQDKNLEISLNFIKMPIDHVQGDPNRIRQILFNLISNAIKFTEHGYININVHLQVEHDFYLLTCEIIDTGIGITPEQQRKLFKAFTQADIGTTREFGGTGLGLAICKNLCELMSGDIKLKSVIGEGSQFTFQIQLEPSTENINNHTHPVVDNTSICFVSPNENNVNALRNCCRQLNIAFTGASDIVSAVAATQTATGNNRILIIDSTLSSAVQKQIVEAREFEGYAKAIACPIKDSNNPASNAQLQYSINKPITRNGLLTLVELANRDKLSGSRATDSDESTKKYWSTATRLLLVEDNKVNQELVVMLLEDLQLQCDIANNGQEALDTLNNAAPGTYALILMDCQMPVMDGYTTSRAIRSGSAGDSNRETPIIAMTANAMKSDRQRCTDAGMNDYLSKPVDHQAFENALVKWLPSNADKAPWTSPQNIIAVKPSANNTMVIDSNMACWNREAALARVKKPERLKILAATILESLPERQEELLQAQLNKDWQQVTFVAHGLKGSAGNFSADKVFSLAKRLETAARLHTENPVDANSSIELENKMNELCQQTLIAISELQQTLSLFLQE